MLAWCSLCVSVCMLTVYNALLMSSAFWCFVLVEACCNGVFMWFCAYRVVAFEAMLCGDMWDVVCDVWE